MRYFTFLLGYVSLLSMLWVACGDPKQKEQITVKLPGQKPVYNCDGLSVGAQDNKLRCDAGYLGSITRTCTDKGDYATWEITDSTCRPPPSQCETDAKQKITFVKHIKPLIEKKCIECHGSARYNEYGPAASIAESALRLIQLGDDNPRRMPPTPRPALEFAEIQLWTDWVADGIINDIECEQEGTRNDINYNDNDKFIDANLNSANSLDGRGKLNARFITADTKFNAGATKAELEVYRAAINDSINQISNLDSNLQFCSSVDIINGSCRIDLESLDLTAEDWEKIVAKATLTFIDNTDKGILLRQITGTDYPAITGSQFIEGAINDSENYYDFLEIDLDLIVYLESRGVDLSGDIADFRARFAGMSDSEVSARKNRLMVFFDSDDGKCSITFDPADAARIDSNLAQFPLLVIGEKQFFFDASETICDMKNGGQEYALWNNLNVRQNVAPTNIVVDFRAGPIHGDFEIKNAIDCKGCHRQGWNPFEEEIKEAVLSNSGDFTAEDIRIVKELYVNQTQLNGIMIAHNDLYTESRKAISINTLKPDPITVWWDEFISPWGLDQLCAHIRIRLSDGCEADLKTTSVAGDLSPIFKGKTIAKAVLDRVFNDIVIELGIGEEPINGFTELGKNKNVK